MKKGMLSRLSRVHCVVVGLCIGVAQAQKSEIKFGDGKTSTTRRHWAAYNGFGDVGSVHLGMETIIRENFAGKKAVLAEEQCDAPCKSSDAISDCTADKQPVMGRLKKYLEEKNARLKPGICLKPDTKISSTLFDHFKTFFNTGEGVKVSKDQCLPGGEFEFSTTQQQQILRDSRVTVSGATSVLFKEQPNACVRGNTEAWAGEQMDQLQGKGRDGIIKPADGECLTTNNGQEFTTKMKDFLFKKGTEATTGGVTLDSSQCLRAKEKDGLSPKMKQFFTQRTAGDAVKLKEGECLKYSVAFSGKFKAYLEGDGVPPALKVAAEECLRGDANAKFPEKMLGYLTTLANNVKEIRTNLGSSRSDTIKHRLGTFASGDSLRESLGDFDAANNLYDVLGAALVPQNSLQDVLGGFNTRNSLKDSLGQLDTALDGLQTTFQEEHKDIADLQEFFETLLIALVVLLVLSFLLLFLAVRRIRGEEQAISRFSHGLGSQRQDPHDILADDIAARIRQSLQQPAAFGQARTPGGVVPGGVLGGQTPLN